MKLTAKPEEIQRRITLALVLEPLADKPGCTTRYVDLSPEHKLVDFETAAVNAAPYFGELARRIQRTKTQPPFYDLCYQALAGSTKNLKNEKYLNFGLLEVLFPLVLAEQIYGGKGAVVCRNVIKVLKQSGPKDLVYKDLTRNLAWSTSRNRAKQELQQLKLQIQTSSLYDEYLRNIPDRRAAGLKTSVLWLEQFVLGLPVLQAMYGSAKKRVGKAGLIAAMELAYKVGMKKIPKRGIIADYCAAVAYLLLADPKTKI